MASSSKSVPSLYRSLLREFRRVYTADKLKESALYSYVNGLFRDHQVTSEKLCREKYELEHEANTYLCLLQSIRKGEELIERYSCPEKSPEEAAALVGLRLPETKTFETDNTETK